MNFSGAVPGLQIREREQQQEELRQQASRPFARTADDADRDMGLRERVRFGDPFADKIQRAQPAAMPAPIVPGHMRKQMKKSGFVVPPCAPSLTGPLLAWHRLSQAHPFMVPGSA